MFSVKRIALAIAIGVLPVGYFVAYEALAIILPPVLYVAGAVAIVILILGGIGCAVIGVETVRTRVAQLGGQRVEFAAKAQIALAEAEQKRVLIITAPRDHQLVVRDTDMESYYRQLHLSPQSHVNGVAAQASPEQIALYRDYHGRGSAAVAEPLMIDAPASTDILGNYGSEWIHSLVLPAPHIHYCGATRSGKTTLANHHIEWIKRQNPDAKFYLLNPKDTAARKPFIIRPQYRDIDEAIEGLDRFNQIMLKRKNDPALSKDANKIVFVIDEWDWIYSVYGQEATRLLVPLVKVGAELKIQVILIGQSPLSGDTGLSQSFYHNMVRVAIWQEGARLLNNYPLDRRYKAPLMAEYEELKAAAPTHEMRTGSKLRYCVVVPMAGNPSVEVIPHLVDPEPIEANEPVKRAKPTPEERELLVTWWRMKDASDFSGSKLYRQMTGSNSRPSGTILENYRQIITRWAATAGFEPGF